MPAYRPSPALRDWLSVRRANVAELMRARGLVDGTGRETQIVRAAKSASQQLNEALVLRIVTEFQGFVRDLLDQATSKMVEGSGCLVQHRYRIVAAAMENRMIDRGNPRLDAIAADAGRLGISQLRFLMLARNGGHAADVAVLASLVELRNAIAHDDTDKVLELSQAGIRPTLGYAKTCRSALDRHARALDHVVWDHLMTLFPAIDPWR